MHSTTAETVTAAIRAELGRQNRSQSQLARDMDKPQQWVNSRLNDRRKLSIDDMAAFAAALNVSISDLIPSDSRASA
jgi:transcriptional regulator with XRE-family HTH domain